MKKIVFVTGTRADYGKIKSLLKATKESDFLKTHIYITGMHLLKEYGYTFRQVVEDGFGECFVEKNVQLSHGMDENIGNTIVAFSKYVHKIQPDYIVVHGDRADALAAAIVGMLNNIQIVHIEGGEVTGTVDDSIRHAISKISHIHMTANEETKYRLLQLGEKEKNIHVIGSPDIDIMLSDKLPKLDAVKERHEIPFHDYGIFIYHPVVTETEKIDGYMDEIGKWLKTTDRNLVVVYPNNDMGSEVIVNHLQEIKGQSNVRMYRSLPFEDFLILLKYADFIIGNSSAGIREACIYGVPCINIGTRQNGRYNPRLLKNIITVSEDFREIQEAIEKCKEYRFVSTSYGNGHSTELFLKAMGKEIEKAEVGEADIQKVFVDLAETKEHINQFVNEGCE